MVFNTGMVGYTESVTDPSYHGQILCQTYPLIGNYGVNRNDFESGRPQIKGYIAQEICGKPSHYTSQFTVNEWLKANGTPGIQGIDTRMLTKKLRERGVMLGILDVQENEIDKEKLLKEAKRIPDPNGRDLVSEVTIGKETIYGNKGRNIVLIDCGTKLSIIKYLLEKGRVVRVPASESADKIMDFDPCAVVVSNGPGDPKRVPYVTKTLRKLVESRLPILGICLGSQILTLALEGDTYKLKFGHRGQNHPVADTKTGRCYITSQNHGFATDMNSFEGREIRANFINLNDGTVEGIEHEKLPIVGYQFHPEASPGPEDTTSLFDKFFKKIRCLHAKV